MLPPDTPDTFTHIDRYARATAITRRSVRSVRFACLTCRTFAVVRAAAAIADGAKMNKAAIVCKLHEIADHYLFGTGQWPPDREVLAPFWKTLKELGLEEDAPGWPGSTQSTALGKELNVELMMAFIGAYDLWEIPRILESNGYLEELEADELYSALPEHADLELRRYVRRAYFRFCNRSTGLN